MDNPLYAFLGIFLWGFLLFMVLSIIFALRFTIVFLFKEIKKIKEKMKSSKLVKGSMISGIIVGMIMLLLQLLTHKDPEFTRYTYGITGMLRHDNLILYRERVLVRNIPKTDLGQYKMMIAYFDSVGLSISELSEMPEIEYYNMWFYKSTYATRKHFRAMAENKDYSYSSGESRSLDRITPYAYIGYVSMFRCKHDSAEWVIKVCKKTGVNEERRITREFTILPNKCGVDKEGAKENDALVKYYMELKDKKNANR